MMEWVPLEKLQEELDKKMQMSLQSRLENEPVLSMVVTEKNFLQFIERIFSARGYVAVRNQVCGMAGRDFHRLLGDRSNWKRVISPLFYLYVIMGVGIFNRLFIVLERPSGK